METAGGVRVEMVTECNMWAKGRRLVKLLAVGTDSYQRALET